MILRRYIFPSYSGHGAKLPDLNGDETDLVDETWCLYDAQLADDELYKLFSQFQAGVRIIVLSDSCHSGSVVKERAIKEAAEDTTRKVRYRAMSSRNAFKVYYANRSFYDPILKDESLRDARNQVRASVLLISGCQDEQLSLDGTFNGLFTGMLLRVWQNGDFTGNYKEFHEEISKDMPKGEKPEEGQTPNYFPVGTANSDFESQKPFTIALP
ncbi:MAG: caspase family protein [Candidatus Electrothrix sp. GM3_4]|nr:caspase family protein [Candidatus Electrothrix sp. GM3_4]